MLTILNMWFEFGKDENENALPRTIIGHEYSSECKLGGEPYCSVDDARKSALYAQYKALADVAEKAIFEGRLGEYKH